MHPWRPSRRWLDTADPDRVWDIELQVEPPSALEALWAAFTARRPVSPGGDGGPPVVDVGGAFVRRDPDRLLIRTGGEDAFDSAEWAADELVEAAREHGIVAQARWTELPAPEV